MDCSIVFANVPSFRQCALQWGHIGGGAPPGEYNWTCASFSPPESTTETASWSVQSFLPCSLQSVVLHVLSPKNCSFAQGDLDRHKYMVPWAHNPIRHLDRFSHFCTAHGRVPSGMFFPLKLLLRIRDLDSHLIYMLPVPTWVHNRNWILVLPFLHRWSQSVPIPYNGPPFPLKIVPSRGECGPHVPVLHGSLGPPESSTQKASRSVQQFCRAH